MVSGDWNKRGLSGSLPGNWSHPHEVPTNPHTRSPFGLHGLGCCRVTDFSRRSITTIPAPALLGPGGRHVVGGPVHTRRAISPRSPIPEQPTCPQPRTAFWPLASANSNPATAASALSYLESHVNAYVTQEGSDGPGQLALLVLDAHALGADPTSFGGTNLVTRLLGTEETSGKNVGLFGTKSQVNDFQAGVYDQGLARLPWRQPETPRGQRSRVLSRGCSISSALMVAGPATSRRTIRATDRQLISKGPIMIRPHLPSKGSLPRVI